MSILTFCAGCPKRSSAQVPVTLNPYQRQTFLDGNGKPLAGGCVFTYQAGTSTPLATYTDSTGLFQNSNPLVLDSSGQGVMWLTANAYRFIAYSSGGLNCASGTQQWVLDYVTPPPFLAGANLWTGNQTFSGTSTFSGTATFNAGGSLSGSFSGSPAFTGAPSFTGGPSFSAVSSTFSVVENFTGGINADVIRGINVGGMTVQAATGSSSAGGSLNLNGGTGSGGAGGAVGITGGAGDSGFAGGNVVISAGLPGAGSVVGASASLNGGSGGGASAGGAATVAGGPGGTTGAGGDVKLSPGLNGAGASDGSVVVTQSGRIKFQVNATTAAPTCSSTGIGGSGTCTLQNYSTDSSGIIVLTPAAGVAANGAATLTFHQTMGANGSFCTFTLVNGSGTWNARATVIANSFSSSAAILAWDDNAVTLTASSTYNIAYFCRGEN